MTPDLWRPHRSGTFQPDGSGIRRNSGNPYCLWEANYKRHSPEEARQRVRRWLQDFAGAFEAAVLLCWNEAEQVWALEFEVRSPDYDSLLPDELDRGQGLQYLRMARECVNCRTKNESYLQSDSILYCVATWEKCWVHTSRYERFVWRILVRNRCKRWAEKARCNFNVHHKSIWFVRTPQQPRVSLCMRYATECVTLSSWLCIWMTDQT